MKSHITVILDRSVRSIEKALVEQMVKHRLNEKSNNISKKHTWDYWIYYSEEDIGDDEIKNCFPQESEEILFNSSFIKNLPKNFITSGVIDQNGKWTDIQDFGWRLLKEPSKENDIAFAKWQQELNTILKTNQNNICIQIITHS